MTPFYERPGFRALERHWRAVLAESGFVDIESPAGKYVDHPAVGMVDGPALERGLALLGLAQGFEGRAQEALADPAFWKGLPDRARRFWTLIVVADWEPKAAARQVGVSERCGRRWFAQIRARLGARR